jgi:hypothetical protein
MLRVSSKQTTVCSGFNRSKPKCFGLFRETKKIVRFVSVLRNRFETNRNKKSAFQNKPKLKINTLLCNGNGRENVHGHDDIGMEMDTDTIFLCGCEPKQTKLDLFRFCFGLFRESNIFFGLFRDEP